MELIDRARQAIKQAFPKAEFATEPYLTNNSLLVFFGNCTALIMYNSEHIANLSFSDIEHEEETVAASQKDLNDIITFCRTIKPFMEKRND